MSRRAPSRRLAADDNCLAFETRSLHSAFGFSRDDDEYPTSRIKNPLFLRGSPSTALRTASVSFVVMSETVFILRLGSEPALNIVEGTASVVDSYIE